MKISKWCSGLDKNVFHNIGLLLFRMVLGIFMLTHGWQKIENFQLMSAGFPDPIGVGSSASLVLIIFAEVGCSLLIILGLFTRIATIPLIIGMIVAAFVIHAGDPFSKIELSSLYLSLYVVLAILGPGKYSLDNLLGIFAKNITKNCQPTNEMSI